MFTPEWFVALGTVIVIDLVLSGDNAIVIGLAASGLPPLLRRKAIIYGMIVATVARIIFAVITFQLLKITGLTLAGGLLLLWVCWKMWREIRDRGEQFRAVENGDLVGEDSGEADAKAEKNFRQALIAIVIADVTMALDNILGVAGAAKEHAEVLIFGLVLSIALMAVAANYIAQIIERYHWIAYVGLAIIGWVSIDMIIRGSGQVFTVISS